jgi:replicative DNA helicase
MISQQLKDLAIELDVCVLLLLQPPKRVGDPSQPIKSYTDIKGSATVAQACSVVMSLWREGFSPDMPENDNFMSFAVLKNRMGGLSQVDCGFEGLTGRVYDLDDNSRDALKAIRAIKKLNDEDLL